jgi:hypothetical protein
MVGRAGALVEVPTKRLGRLGMERSDDPIALVAIDLDRGEALRVTLVSQLGAARRSEVANPVCDPILREEVPSPVYRNWEQRHLNRLTSAATWDHEDGHESESQPYGTGDSTDERQ